MGFRVWGLGFWVGKKEWKENGNYYPWLYRGYYRDPFPSCPANYFEVRRTCNLLRNCSYNLIISHITMVTLYNIWFITTVTKQVISTMDLQVEVS